MIKKKDPISLLNSDLNVGKSSLDKWVRQLQGERNGITSKATPLAPDQLKIREVEALAMVRSIYAESNSSAGARQWLILQRP